MTKIKHNASKSDDIKLNNTPSDGNIFDASSSKQAVLLESKEVSLSPQNKDKPKRDKKKTFLHELKTIGILMFMGIFIGSGLGVWYFNSELRIDVNYNIDPTPYLYNINSVMNKTLGLQEDEHENFLNIAKSQGKTPAHFTPAQNFALAEYHASLANTWTAIGEGEIATVITQSLYSEKKYNGEKATFVNISISSLVKVAKCYELYDGANMVGVFNGSNPQKDHATWNEGGEKTISDFKSEMGVLPNAIQPYIISDKTITKGNSVDNVVYDDLTGNYSFTIELDTVASVLYYVNQVKATGGLQAYPKFHKITQTITIDGDWNLVSIEVKDSYDAIVGIKASCKGVLKTYYTFNQPDIEMPV